MSAGTITSLRAQVNDPERVNVFVDGEFALGVSLNTITRAGLFVGKPLSEAEIQQLAQLESADKAYQAALRYLEARPRATAEVRSRLERKEFTPEAIDAAIERLGQLGLIDDAAFARFWIDNRQLIRPRGANALRDELRRKGIAADVLASAIEANAEQTDEGAQALALARSALRKYANAPDRTTFTRRLGGYLQRRGYTFEVIRPIIDQLWAELSGPEV